MSDVAGEILSNSGALLGPADPAPVEIYRANVMTKMAANSLSDLVRMAMLADILGGTDKVKS